MGACYSHKASSGNHTYTTVQMTSSTKLEDSSRLSRVTPYSRNSAPFPVRKGIPIAKTDHSSANNQANVKSHLQSSIPRFSSSSSMTKQEVNDNLIFPTRIRGENNSLNLVNNNAISVSQSPNGLGPLSTNSTSGKMPLGFCGNKGKINTSSKSYPDNISKQLNKSSDKLGNKTIPKFSHGSSSIQYSSRSQTVTKIQQPGKKETYNCDPTSLKCDKILDSSSSDIQADIFSSKSLCMQSDSHDSITDLDSGLGSSVNEKNKQDDRDTLKDVEGINNATVSFHGYPTINSKKQATETIFESSSKLILKCPMYKRSLNGKWVRQDNVYPNQIPKANSMIKSSSQSVCSFDKPKNSQNINVESFLYKKPISQVKNISSLHQKEQVTASERSDIPKVSNIISNASPTRKSISNAIISNLQKSLSSEDHSSLESDDKSDGFGSETKSLVSDGENRDFLDDEISDQPYLISVSHSKNAEDVPALSLQQSVTELYALSSAVKGGDCKTRERLGSDHRDSLLLGSELGSSCSSIESDDMMLDFEKRNEFPDGTVNEGLASPLRKLSDLDIIQDNLSELGLEKLKGHEIEDKAKKRLQRRLSNPSGSGSVFGKDEWRSRSVSCPLRPPRPMSVSEAEDGSIILDSSSYRLLSQDLNGVKTLLLRLKGVIQEADTISPFDQVNLKNFLYPSLVLNDAPSFISALSSERSSISENFSFENADMRQQLVLLQQELEDKNRTIHLLQQQMTKYANFSGTDGNEMIYVNAATQTERPRSLPDSFSSSVDDDSMETLVSVQDVFEEHMEKNLKEQVNLLNKVDELSRSLNSLCQDLFPLPLSRSLSITRSHSSSELSEMKS